MANLQAHGLEAARTGSGRLARERAGYTVADLAEYLGVSVKRAAHMELGKIRLRAGHAARYGAWLQSLGTDRPGSPEDLVR